MGHGSGIILLYGGANASQHFHETYLSNDFTVYILDKRGRGLSGTLGKNNEMKREMERRIN